MASIKGKTALVTGASSGIGKITVEMLLAEGAKVYAAARRTEKMKDIEEKGAKIFLMDVTDEESVKAGIKSILEKEGSVDILVNNAGYGSYGAIEDVPMEEAKRQFDVNVFAVARLIQLILPEMRKNRYGKIINISSIAGKIYTPFGGWYHATKHALEGLSDCMRLETKPFGIDVVIIEPGAINTEWASIAAENLKKTSGKGAYSRKASQTAENMLKMYATPGRRSEPSVIAEAIIKAVKAKKPKTRYSAGAMAKLSLFGRKWLSDRQFDSIISRMM